MAQTSAVTTRAKRIISVGSGKGGAGKSIIASNLAVAIAQDGQRVVLIDADLGAPNLHIMFGLLRPHVGLSGFISRQIEELAEAQVDTAVDNLVLIPGGNVTPGIANINFGQKQRMLNHIRALDAEVVLIDVGAGSSHNVVDLFELADTRVVAVVPQLTSLQNAYAFLKSAVYRILYSLARTQDKETLIDASAGREMERITDVIAVIRGQDADLAERITGQLANFGCFLMGNQLTEDEELRVLHAFSRMVENFLGIASPVAGYLSNTARVRASVNQRRPFLLDGRLDRNTLVVKQLAKLVLEEQVASIRGGRNLVPQPEMVNSPVAPASNVEQAVAGHVGTPSYQRQVNCQAMLNRTKGQLRVDVWAVSLNGVLVNSPAELDIGERARLIFHELPGKPVIQVAVQNARDNFYALEFLESGEIPKRILRAVNL